MFCNFTESEILQMTPLMFSAAQTQAEMHSMSLKLVSEKGDLLLMKMSLTGHSSSWLLCDFHPSKSDIFRNTLWVHVRVHKKKHMTSVTYEELEVALAANATFLVCIAPLSDFTVSTHILI